MTFVRSQVTVVLVESNLAWATGVLEGEGCFTLVKNSKAKGGQSAKIVLQMNDLDIVERVRAAFNNKGAVYQRPPRGNSKESWQWNVYKAADVKEIIYQILPLLGKRRTEKVYELLNWINNGV